MVLKKRLNLKTVDYMEINQWKLTVLITLSLRFTSTESNLNNFIILR